MVTYAISEKSTVLFRSSQNNIIIFSKIVVIKIITKSLKLWIRILLVVQRNQYLSLFQTSKGVINFCKRLVIQRNWTLNGSYITTEYC